MKVAIGIMLWNEQESIGMTIDSVFSQTLLSEVKPGVESVEVVALANGCTDASVPNAKAAFKRNLRTCQAPYVSAWVEELPKGRSAAWNKFVHEMTSPDTTYIVFMDADIYINNCNALWSMIKGLEEGPYHPVAAALGLKDTQLKSRQSLWERATNGITKLEHHARLTYLCGGLYCGRTSFFRRMWFPDGWVCGDDGFLARMAITNYMTTAFQFDRILHPADASFVFEAYTSIPRLFRQHRRRQIGMTVIHMICDHIRDQQARGSPDAGVALEQLSRQNPEWLIHLVKQRIAEAGFWFISWRRIFLRMNQLCQQPWPSRILQAPLAVMGTVWLAAVVLSANRMMKRDEIADVWENNKNVRLVESAQRMSLAAKQPSGIPI